MSYFSYIEMSYSFMVKRFQEPHHKDNEYGGAIYDESSRDQELFTMSHQEINR
jgi:hypothetical protein